MTDDEWQELLDAWVGEVRREREGKLSRRERRRRERDAHQAGRMSRKVYANAWRARRAR